MGSKENNKQMAENSARTVLFLVAAKYLEMKMAASSRGKGREGREVKRIWMEVRLASRQCSEPEMPSHSGVPQMS